MKDMKYYLQLMLLACSVFFVACSDDDDDSVLPVFPEAQSLAGVVGGEQTLTFEASQDWTLTSSALWCSFRNGEEKTYSCSGSAGKQSVTIYVGDDAMELEKSYTAELTLTMGGKRQVICKVTRPVDGYEVHLFDADETEEFTVENPLMQDYDGKQSIVVTANFDWCMLLPEALSSSVVSGLAGEKVTIKPELVKGFTKNPAEWTLNFKNKEEQIVASASVKYDGIPANKIEFSISNPWTGITFAADGSTYKLGDVKYDERALPLTVVAREDKYTVVYVDYQEVRNEITWEYEYQYTVLPEEDSWFWVESEEPGKLELHCMNNQDLAKTGYLMIFPNAVYEEVKNDFENLVFDYENGGILREYEDFLAIKVMQEANARFTTGFEATDGNGDPLLDENGGELPLYSYQDMIGATDEELIEEFGTTNVHILSLPLGYAYDYIIAKPNGFEGYYVQPDTYVGNYPNGHDTAWPNVSVESDWNLWSGKAIAIYGIAEDTNGAEHMIIKCMNNSDIYAVLIVERYNP